MRMIYTIFTIVCILFTTWIYWLIDQIDWTQVR